MLVDNPEGDSHNLTNASQSLTKGLIPIIDREIISTYRPNVSKITKEWLVSPIDLLFIAEGNGVLGTGMMASTIAF